MAVTSVLAYHDPDLNYHVAQAQKLQNCGDTGYSYPAPAVQLSTAGVKVAAPVYTQSLPSPPATYLPAASYSAGYSSAGYANAGYANSGYSTGLAYQAVAPKIAYAAPATAYQSSINYAASAANEVHGYSTSAGLSAVAAPKRTVIPQATYAQAPIIAKVTAAPLIAKFSLSPAKTTYTVQNLISQQSAGVATSAAKASLNSYSSVQSGGPVVSQVYAAPSSGYATSPALRAPTVAQYHQANAAQYASSGSNVASSSQYFSPAVTQYSAPAVAQYSAPAVAQYAAPAVAQYATPAVAHYAAPQVTSVQHYAAAPAAVSHVAAAPAVQYSVPTTYTQYSSPAVQYATGSSASHYASSGASSAQYSSSGASVQYAAAPVAHVAAPVALAAPAHRISAAPVAAKNVHTEFLENYVSFLL